MALDLGVLVARLRVDDSHYNASLRAAPKTAEDAGRKIGRSLSSGTESGFKGIGSKVGGILVGLGLGKMAIDAGKFGIETYMAGENASIGFTTMLGSAKRAETFMGQLRAFAKDTPFAFPELQTAASSLISVGIKADKVIPIMRSLGNATAGMGSGSEGVKRATVALQQMNAAGRITGEDLNQLRDAGIPVYELLAKATGKSVKAVADLAQKGKLGKTELDAMMKALESGKGLERFNGLMEKQAGSLEGMLGNLKDTLGTGLATAIDNSGLDTKLKGGIAAVSAALPALLSNLQGFVEWLIQSGVWIQQNEAWLRPLASAIGGGAAAIVIIVGAMRAWAAVQLFLNAAMTANPIGIIITLVGLLVGALIYAYQTSDEFRANVDTALSAVGAVFRWLWNSAVAPVIRFLINGFAWVVGGIANMLGALGEIPGFGWAKDAATKMREAAKRANDLADGVKDIPNNTDVNISLHIKGLGRLDALGRNFKALGIMGARAKGGPIVGGMNYLVGEDGPEIITAPKGGGNVIPAGESKRILGRGAEAPKALGGRPAESGGNPFDGTLMRIVGLNSLGDYMMVRLESALASEGV